MYAKSLVALLPLLGSTLASPIESRQVDAELQNLHYGIMALRSASPVHFLQVNAIAGRLYLGGQTTSYCPPEQEYNSECPPGNATIFAGSCALASKSPQYPSGQTIWNRDDGTIGYDFSQVRPDNTYNCPWYIGTSENTAFNGTIESTPGADGFVACPTAQTGTWQLMRSVGSALKPPQGDASACLGVSLVALGYNATRYGAWVYS